MKRGGSECRNYVNNSDSEERTRPVGVKDIPDIGKLSAAEKILLVEDLWDSIASDESAVPVPQSHIRELDRRFKKYQSAPGNLVSLEELQSAIKKRTINSGL
ncbi:MAG: addiction module protein [bacterium]|nr:addiction module protein [bacterium]